MNELAFSINAFCKAIDCSRRHFYNLDAKGEAPKTIWIGGRRVITRPTAEQWIAEREQDQQAA